MRFELGLIFGLTVFSPVTGLAKGSQKPPQTAYHLIDCSPADWSRDPEMNDGHFEAAVGADCRVKLKDSAKYRSPTEIALRIKNHILETRKIITPTEFGRKPAAAPSPEVTNEWIVDTLSTLDEDGTEISILETVTLKWDQSAMLFKTDSKEVKAKGMAGYLKRVAFHTEIRTSAEPLTYETTMINAVSVERPWYALAPIFFAIAKGVTKDKFKIASDKLFQMLGEYF